MLAIIIPFFKLTFFEATLQSLANQTDKRFKVYIGDDASPEDCSTLLKNFDGEIDYVYHRFETNLGSTSLTQQWERCIAISQEEEWLMILGDDDELDFNVIELFYENYNEFKDKSELIRYASKQINEKTNTVSKLFTNPKWEKSVDFFIRKQKGETRSSLSECIFSRKVYYKYGFRNYPLAWHSDDMAWIEYADLKLVYGINEAVIIFRMSFENISGKISNYNEKLLAEYCFLNDLLNEKFYFFNSIQKLELLKAYESCLRKYKRLVLSDWFILLKYYLLTGKIIPVLKLVRRVFIYFSNCFFNK